MSNISQILEGLNRARVEDNKTYSVKLKMKYGDKNISINLKEEGLRNLLQEFDKTLYNKVYDVDDDMTKLIPSTSIIYDALKMGCDEVHARDGVLSWLKAWKSYVGDILEYKPNDLKIEKEI